MSRIQISRMWAHPSVSLRRATARPVRRARSGWAILFSLCCFCLSPTAQAAPLPQGNLLSWFRADAGVTVSGTEVTTWADQATTVGGANNATRVGGAGTGPAVATGIGGMPTLRFDGANDYLEIASNTAFNSQEFTWFIVAQADVTSPSGSDIVLRSNYSSGAGGGSSTLWSTFNSSAGVFSSHARDSSSTFVGAQNPSNLNPALISARWAADDTVSQWLNGTIGTGGTGATAVPAGHVYTRIASQTGGAASNTFDGDISEIIIYNTTLNTVNRRLIENNLAAKYSGTVGANALPLSNELYAGDDVAKGNYDLDVFGIGRESDGIVASRSDDLGLALAQNLSGPNTLDIGEYALAGHKVTATGTVSTDVPGGERWARSWYIDTTGSFDATLTFDFSDAGVAFDSSLTQLLFRSTESGNFSALSSSGTIVGDQVSFNLLLSDALDGYFTLGFAPVIPEPSSLSLIALAGVGLAVRRRKRHTLH